VIQDEHNLSAGWIFRKGPVHFNYGHIISGAGLLILYGGKMKRLLSLLMFFMLTAAAPLFSQENNAEEADQKEKVKPTSVFQMGEIVVRDRALANIEDASTTTEITEADIKARGDKTLDQALQQVPGMNVYQGQKGQQGFTLRGFKHDKVVILVDGLPFEEIYDGGGGDISRIPVMNASKIVVNRGVSSALYGARGTFGTINVITQKPDVMFTKISAEYGQHNNYMLNVSHGAPIGDFYYWITGSVVNSDGYDVSGKLTKSERKKWFNKFTSNLPGRDADTVITDGNYALDNYVNGGDSWDHTEFRRYYLSGKAGYKITDNLEAGISASYYQNEQLFLGFYPNVLASYDEELDKWNNVPDNTGGKAIFQQRDWEWDEDYRYDISPYLTFEKGDLSVRASLFYVSQMNSLIYWNDPDLSQSSTPRWDPSKVYEDSYGFYVYPSYKITSWNKVSGVVHYRSESYEKKESDRNNLSAPYETTKEMSASYVTVGVEDEMSFKTAAGDLGITVGVSYDAQEFDRFKKPGDPDGIFPDDDSMLWGTNDSFNPVAGLMYEPLKDFLVIRGSAGMKVEFPNLHQVSDNDDAGVTKELNPEKSYNGNIGVELFFLNKTLSLRNDYFYTKFKDKIERLRDDVADDDINMNIEGRTVQGIESTISYTLKEIFNVADMNLSQSYVYIHARDNDDSIATKGTTVAETPEHQFITQIIFDFISGTSLNIWGNYKMNERTYIMKSDPGGATEPYSTDYYTTVKLHDPLMFNIKISQKIMENYEVYVMCKNIFDDYNADPFNPGPGRMFYFGGSASF